MNRITLVRHGQASYGQADYDQLSGLGERQSRRLGSYWAQRGVQFEFVFVGPRQRHRQTHDAVADEYARRGLAWPEPVVLAGHDEYPAFEIMHAALPPILEKEPETRKVFEALAADPEASKREYFRLFRRITTAWVSGDIETPGLETWQSFCSRVLAAFLLMAGKCAAGNVAVFTSGGPIAASIGHVLELSPQKTMELSWAVLNGSFNDILVGKDRFALGSFNETPHLDDPELLTGS